MIGQSNAYPVITKCLKQRFTTLTIKCLTKISVSDQVNNELFLKLLLYRLKYMNDFKYIYHDVLTK